MKNREFKKMLVATMVGTMTMSMAAGCANQSDSKSAKADTSTVKQERTNKKSIDLDTEDEVEKIGVEKARKYANQADLVIYVVDSSRELDENDERYPGNDPKYTDLTKDELPKTENLIDTIKRVTEYWKSDIEPDIKNGKNVIIKSYY